MAYSPRSSCRASTPCRKAKASSLPVRTMPVVVQAAMSRRTLSKFRRHTSSVLISSLKPVGSVLAASSVGKRAVEVADEGLVDQPEEQRMHVGEASVICLGANWRSKSFSSRAWCRYSSE